VILTHIIQLFRDIWQQKLRTVMTLFGLVWGTVAVILLLTFGNGLYKVSLKSAHGLGEGICIMWGSRTSIPYEGLPRGRYIPLRETQIPVLKQQIPSIKWISPEYGERVEIRVGKESYQSQLSAVYPEFQLLRNIIPVAGGRFINAIDQKFRRRVVFIGDQVEKDLFGDEKGLGKSIQINGSPFKIIGVLKEKIQSSNYNGRDSRRIIIPASTYTAIYGEQDLNNLVFKAHKVSQTEIMKDRVYQVMAKINRFDPKDREPLSIWDTSGMDEFLDTFFGGFIIFLGIVGSMTLIVAGIGLSNIMYIVVEERTREIGIKRALGARKRVILSQFIIETLLLTVIGGGLGFLISGLMISGLNMADMGDTVGQLSLSYGIGSTTAFILGVIGFIAGWFPAKKAASLDPVDAIRFGG